MGVLKEVLRPTDQGDLLQVAAGIDDLPLDDPASIPADGSDSLIAAFGSQRHQVVVAHQHANREALAAQTKPGVVRVPFVRDLRPGMSGRDVIAVQRALRAAGFRSTRPTGLYGGGTEKQVKEVQHRHGIVATGFYGRRTHTALIRYFDAYGAFLMGADASKADARERVVQTALLGYAHRAAMHYTQGSHRMDGVNLHLKPPKFPQYADCSAFATWCYWAAGLPDPNVLGYDGQGYTGTLCEHGRAVPFALAKPGDLVLYGFGVPWEHVAVYIGSGRVVSMGSEPGPFILPVAYRPIGQIRSYI